MVYVPKYIVEMSPKEIRGPAGALSQMMIQTGTLIAFLYGLGVGELDNDDSGSFTTEHYWKVVFAMPIIVALTQVFLLLVVFPYETPVVLKERDDMVTLNELMRRIYPEQDVAKTRI